MKPHSDISDPRIIKALTHPLRVSILGALEQRTASPSELADELGAPLGNVSYHVRQLASLGLIKLVKKTPRRGAIEHHYKAVGRTEISDEAWSSTPDIVKEAVIASSLAEIGKSVNGSAAGGGFSRPDAHLSRTAMTLDEQGWKELSKELARTLERVRRIEEQSDKRLSKGGHNGERQAGVVLMLFEAAEAEAGAASSRNNGRASKRRTRARA